VAAQGKPVKITARASSAASQAAAKRVASASGRSRCPAGRSLRWRATQAITSAR
jgi:hypothetical protein